ncbi:DUF3085 domain-containing protein [Salmonella enterica]|uniref:DUF3085 domain-containing protein n=1 Tax=Salmonella enterica TaxID=28901 RepID=UPI0009ACDE70|nr:DUF3085 domain-containing protein [Salmonella enterica]EBP4342197.1 DUF3085 domain-containing protein [Salmonella enterica]ELW2864693.1 DUF3085 domain-containing protein [Salmonella enterica]
MMKDARSVIFKAETLIPVIQEAMNNKCAVFIVKDHGLYMMSEQGEFDQNTGKRLTLSYAEGFNPDLIGFDDWYYELKEVCGGDDFCETLPVTDSVLQEVIRHNADLKISFTPTQFRYRAVNH